MPKLTKRLVDATAPDPARKVKVYDTELRGFGLVVYPSGRRSFFVEYGAKGRRRRMTIGAHGPLTVEQARTMARAKLGEVATGADPLGERRAADAVPTFEAWKDTHMERVERNRKRPDLVRHYLDRAAERWGRRRLDEITRADVEAELRREAERGHTTANRWLTTVRACLGAALRDGLIPANPAAGIAKYCENPPRDRVLSDDELGRVVDALANEPDLYVRAAIGLMLDTGARRSEVLRARWDDFDLDGGLWRIPSPKAGRPQRVPLTADTVAWLRSVPRLGPWFVPGLNPLRHRVDLKGPWKRIREAAGVCDVTIHDVRRTWGLAVARTAGIHVASKLLRHSDIRMTESTYAPLGIDELRDAAAATQRKRGEVLAFRRASGDGDG